MRLFASLVLVLAWLASPTHAATHDAIDEYIEAEMAKRRIPGLALAVVEKGAVTKMRGYGLANLELDVPVGPESVFELASVTKQFTAAAIMLLVEEGKIALDDAIAKHLPPVPDSWRAMTVRHLLTHTAGFPGLANGFRALRADGTRLNYTTAQMFEAATKDRVSFAPGTRWQYSDVGYFLLGMIIEKASGQRYGEFLSERFFKPLGMTATSVLDQRAIIKGRVAGYTLIGGQHAHIRRHTQVELVSHFGVFSSVEDLVRWEVALAGGKVLKPSSLAAMWTPLTFNDGTRHLYGFGWQVYDIRGRRVITHSGITGTEYTRYPDDGLTVIVLTNLGRYVTSLDVDSWGLTHGIARRRIPGLSIHDLKQEPDATGMAPRMRALLEDMAAGAKLETMVPRLRSNVSSTGRKIMSQRLAQATDFAFIACEDAQAKSVERFGERVARACYFRMIAPAETRYFTFHLTADGRVADFGSYTD